ncbi:MAG: Gfo/Idh/MocA family oxidoreductase [Verrucomicrobiota bacterium]
MKVSIIGTGLQCKRRAPVLLNSPETTIAWIAARTLEQAEKATQTFAGMPTADWRQAVEDPSVDAVIVTTPPDLHAEIAIAAMLAGKHVLCEKPLARTLAEAEAMVKIARETQRILKCGFSYRFYPAIRAAHQMVQSGKLGRPLFGRCRYGICGRPGYEKEWRADPNRTSGGHFFEAGGHAIDLFRWFLGEIVDVSAMTSLHYFKEQPLDDGGMALFRCENGATASLHTTLVEWKNLFSFEIFGEEGYVQINGLGGSYGEQSLTYGRRDFHAPFQDTVTHFRGADPTWKLEWENFVEAIQSGKEPSGSGADGLAAMRVALAAYDSERQRVVGKIGSGL